MSSHDIEDIQRFADRVVFLKDGTVEMQEEVEPLLARHRAVTITFAEVPALSSPLPETWRHPAIAGRTLRYTDTAYHESRSREEAARHLPPFLRHETHPLTLRDIFVSAAKSPQTEPLTTPVP